MFPYLLHDTAKYFEIKEVTADKGYSSRKNLGLVSDIGAIPFIPFRKDAVSRAGGFAIWNKMYRYFKDHKEDFMRHYHLRSNAESIFSMIKRKQGDYLRTKNDIAQVNEIMCKCLVHNICVLIQEMFELGIKVDFQEVMPQEFMCRIGL
jgi:transposase